MPRPWPSMAGHTWSTTTPSPRGTLAAALSRAPNQEFGLIPGGKAGIQELQTGAGCSRSFPPKLPCWQSVFPPNSQLQAWLWFCCLEETPGLAQPGLGMGWSRILRVPGWKCHGDGAASRMGHLCLGTRVTAPTSAHPPCWGGPCGVRGCAGPWEFPLGMLPEILQAGNVSFRRLLGVLPSALPPSPLGLIPTSRALGEGLGWDPVHLPVPFPVSQPCGGVSVWSWCLSLSVCLSPLNVAVSLFSSHLSNEIPA